MANLTSFLDSILSSARGGIRRIAGHIKHAAGRKNLLETIVGIGILFGALYFLVWSLATARTSRVSGYTLRSQFSSSGGLSRGADVSVNGVRVGSVDELRLDPKNYMVEVVMTIDSRYRFASDSIARITTSGLIGEQRIVIVPGTSGDMIRGGGTIGSEPFKSLEEIISDVIFK